MLRFYSILSLLLLLFVQGNAQTISLPLDTTICFNEEYPATIDVEDDWDTYVWTDSTGAVVGINNELSISSEGEYFLVATDTTTPMSVSGSVVIFLHLSPVPIWNRDTTICPEETIEITVRNPSDYDQIKWSFPAITTEPPVEGATFMASISDTGTYLLEISDSQCEDDLSYEETLDTCERFVDEIPNVFSPNADGMNDMFLFTGMEVAEYDLLIFDRWGRQVYESHDIEQSWDGNVGGKQASEGVYYFTLRYRLRAKEEVVECTQPFTLVR